MRLLALLGALFAASLAVASPTPDQIPFSYDALAVARKDGPVDAHDVNVKTIQHASWPAHSLRVKALPPSLCEKDPHVRSWAGYLDVDLDKLWESYNETEKDRWAKHPKGVSEHSYFAFFEARNHAHDDVLLWLNGGPGCSSFTGALAENGPCKVQSNGKGTVNNPHSWSDKTSVLYLDQPAGVGFSYTSWTSASTKEAQKKAPPPRVWDTTSAARDASAFLHLMALHANESGVFPGVKLPRLHLAGESYAGRYIPLLAHQILLDNEAASQHPERGLQPLPLTTLLLGNSWVSPIAQYPALMTMSCSNDTRNHPGPFLNKTVCSNMARDEPTCSALLARCNLAGSNDDANYDVLACQMAFDYCESRLSDPWQYTGSSPYDWRRKDGDLPEEKGEAIFLNDARNQEAMGIDKAAGEKHNGTWQECSDAVGEQFYKSGDGSRESTWAVKELLEKGVRTLAYYGDADKVCNWRGGQVWTHDLVWAHGDEWRRAPTQHWYTTAGEGKKAQPAGEYREFGGLTFATVWDAGHFVPHDQPAVALDMLHYWLYGSHPGKLEA